MLRYCEEMRWFVRWEGFEQGILLLEAALSTTGDGGPKSAGYNDIIG